MPTASYESPALALPSIRLLLHFEKAQQRRPSLNSTLPSFWGMCTRCWATISIIKTKSTRTLSDGEQNQSGCGKRTKDAFLPWECVPAYWHVARHRDEETCCVFSRMRTSTMTLSVVLAGDMPRSTSCAFRMKVFQDRMILLSWNGWLRPDGSY